MKWKVLFYRIFYRKYVRLSALIITILVATLLISQLSKSFSSSNTTEFNNILDTGFNFHYDTTPSSFILTIKHENIRKYLNLLGILVIEKQSSSFRFFSAVSKLNNLRVGQSEIIATIDPPLNSIYNAKLIMFSTQKDLNSFIEKKDYFIFDKKHKADSHNGVVLYSIDMEISNPFYVESSDDPEYSSMFCIGNDYLTRWCRMKNACLSNNELFLFSPYDIIFNDTFLVPGSRSPPYDPDKFRFTADNIKIVNDDIEEYSKSASVEFEQRTVQVTSRFYNSRMLWHNVMDCLVPTFWTMTSNYVGITNNDYQKYEFKQKRRRSGDQSANETLPTKPAKEYLVSQDYGYKINLDDDILVYDNEGSIGLFYLKAFTNNEIILSETLQHSKRCFKHVNIGLRKTEINPKLNRQRRESLVIKYQIDPLGIRGLRQTMLNAIPRFETNKGKDEDMKMEKMLKTINEISSLISEPTIQQISKQAEATKPIEIIANTNEEINKQNEVAKPTETISETHQEINKQNEVAKPSETITKAHEEITKQNEVVKPSETITKAHEEITKQNEVVKPSEIITETHEEISKQDKEVKSTETITKAHQEISKQDKEVKSTETITKAHQEINKQNEAAKPSETITDTHKEVNANNESTQLNQETGIKETNSLNVTESQNETISTENHTETKEALNTTENERIEIINNITETNAIDNKLVNNSDVPHTNNTSKESSKSNKKKRRHQSDKSQIKEKPKKSKSHEKSKENIILDQEKNKQQPTRIEKVSAELNSTLPPLNETITRKNKKKEGKHQHKLKSSETKQHSKSKIDKIDTTLDTLKMNKTRKTIKEVDSTSKVKKQSNKHINISKTIFPNSTKPILLEQLTDDRPHSRNDFICNPTPEKPLVIIIQRKTKREVRRLINHDAIVEETKKLCTFCNVQELDLQKYDKYGQIRHVCGASLLVGVHGSGLIHALWLKPSTEEAPTGIVEFLPYKYTCRKWYHEMCDIARIQYYKVDTMNRNQSRWESGHNETKVERCLNGKDECLRERCHDFLRDQSIIADLDLYRNVTRPYFDQLEKAYKKAMNQN